VSVDYDAVGFAEPRAEDDVSSFAGDARDGQELVHFVGNLAAEIFDDRAGSADDRLGFVTEKSGGLDIGFEFFGMQGREVLWRWVLLKDDGRDHVHADVGALRGEDGGDEEFPCAGVREGAGGAGVHFVEAGEDLGHALWCDGIVSLRRFGGGL